MNKLKQKILNKIVDVFSFALYKAMQKEEIQKELWKVSNVRPNYLETHWSSVPNSIREHRMLSATQEAAEFVQNNIANIEGEFNSYITLEKALSKVQIEGSYVEFGVYKGDSINFIATKAATKNIYGFDSFEGLPESWGPAAKGAFDRGGQLPDVKENVTLYKGWFDETIDQFLNDHDENVAFIHADADLYSSTATILSKLESRIVSGTVIVFDEYLNYPDWKEHEYKAFMEFIERTNHEFEYLGYTDRGYSVSVIIK